MIKFIVTGQQLAVVTPAVIVADTLDYITAEFTFNTTDWTGLAKYAYFQSPDTTADPFYVLLDENDKITTDKHVRLSEGNWQVYLVGLDSSTSGTSNTRITTSTTILNVQESLNGGTFPVVNPTVSEQLTVLVNGVVTKANNGSFDGATFTPSVSDAGVISWTNDKEKTNPESKNIKGPKGDTGDAGTAATIAVGTTTTGAAGTQASVTNSGTTSAAVFNFVIPKGDKGDTGSKGDKGDTGAGFVVKGYYATLAELIAGVPSPSAGDAYGVGTSAPYEIYIYSGTSSSWVDNGTIQGAKGDKGDTGATGPQGAAATIAVGTTTTGEAGTSASVVNVGTTSAAIFNFTIPKGAKGDTGATGAKGDKGDKPVKEVDYWIDTDKAYVIAQAKNGVINELTPAALGAIANPSTKSSGQYLKYDGSAWVADTVSGGVSSVDSKTGAVVTRVLFTDQTCSSFALQATPEYAKFPYVGSIALSGVLSTDYALVTFDCADAISGLYAPVVKTYSGGIYLYRRKALDSGSILTVPTILIIKGNAS